ncbi:Os07g0569301 [Oryza sativa Japonica Group]|uniref:Os07g0569301 protein n=1 Tax=Oryza sativa subsp. japonica TaxID=39947 RepID=A0A0N7KNP8_ORYSJ|nr:Os07g0569301 [Oryza sativa Japonica Group]
MITMVTRARVRARRHRSAWRSAAATLQSARARARGALCVYDVVAWWLARRARGAGARARSPSVGVAVSTTSRARESARRRAPRVTAAVGSARAAHVAGHPGQADNRVV